MDVIRRLVCSIHNFIWDRFFSEVISSISGHTLAIKVDDRSKIELILATVEIDLVVFIFSLNLASSVRKQVAYHVYTFVIYL